ncbi:carboxylesterase BioH [Vibrio cholerae NCTC 8457]|nr:carboxylesterase BioH [Vibrio cholerae NCTC 8457]
MALYWQVSGQGQDLVLVHGWGMNGAVWQQTAQALSDHFRVHVVDLPGYGHSAEQHAASLEEIAQALLEHARARIGSLSLVLVARTCAASSDYVSKW